MHHQHRPTLPMFVSSFVGNCGRYSLSFLISGFCLAAAVCGFSSSPISRAPKSEHPKRKVGWPRSSRLTPSSTTSWLQTRMMTVNCPTAMTRMWAWSLSTLDKTPWRITSGIKKRAVYRKSMHPHENTRHYTYTHQHRYILPLFLYTTYKYTRENSFT